MLSKKFGLYFQFHCIFLVLQNSNALSLLCGYKSATAVQYKCFIFIKSKLRLRKDAIFTSIISMKSVYHPESHCQFGHFFHIHCFSTTKHKDLLRRAEEK